MANSSLIKIKNLSKSFGTLKVLDNISVDIYHGENFVVFGQSGTGKSVLLKCIVGLLKPDSGKIIINGKDILQLSLKKTNELRKEMGFLFQSAALYDSMSVRENLEFPLKRNFHFSKNEINEKVVTTLHMVGLDEAIDKMPSELSGGMRKRIGLARAIITEPKIILYDEPTTGLDPITSKEISELILRLQNRFEMTSVIVTHDLLCAKIISNRAIVLNKSVIVKEGSIEELTNSNNKFLKSFFNS